MRLRTAIAAERRRIQIARLALMSRQTERRGGSHVAAIYRSRVRPRPSDGFRARTARIRARVSRTC